MRFINPEFTPRKWIIMTGMILFTGWPLLGQVKLVETTEVTGIMNQFKQYGKEEPYIEGWRIKLISTTDRRKMEKARWLFTRLYPEINYTQNHESPYYSLIVGSFETRIDLEQDLLRYKQDFPLAIPFRDKVMKTELFMN